MTGSVPSLQFARRRESRESRGKRTSTAKHQTVAFDPLRTKAALKCHDAVCCVMSLRSCDDVGFMAVLSQLISSIVGIRPFLFTRWTTASIRIRSRTS